MLLTLWMQIDKTEFHRAYKQFEREFNPLISLRDGKKWTVYFE